MKLRYVIGIVYITCYIGTVVLNKSLMGLKVGEVGDFGTQIPKSQ